MHNLPPPPLTVKQAAEALGYSIWHVYKLMEDRQIEFTQSGTAKRIPVAAVAAFMAKITRPVVEPSVGPSSRQTPASHSPTTRHRPKSVSTLSPHPAVNVPILPNLPNPSTL